MKPHKPFKPITLQRKRFTWRVWWTIAVLACMFVLGVVLSLLVDGAVDVAGHAVVAIWQPAHEASATPAPAPSAQPSQPTAAALPLVLSCVGVVFLFGLIWGTCLVLDDEEQTWGGHQATFWRTVICAALGAGMVVVLRWGMPGLFDLRWASLAHWWAACWASWASPGQTTSDRFSSIKPNPFKNGRQLANTPCQCVIA